MARFDVYRNPIKVDREHTPYVMEVQSDLLDVFRQRVCVPLILAKSIPGLTDRFNPLLQVESTEVRFHPLGIGVFLSNELKERVTSCRADALRLETALDMLLRGY